MKNLISSLSILVLLFVARPASAQLPGTSTDAGVSSSTSSTTPDLAECRSDYSRSELCPGPVRIPPPPRAHWYIVINGDLRNSRQHGEVETDYGHGEYGIGGEAVCPPNTVPLVIAPSGLRYLNEAAGHRLIAGTYCAPLGSQPGTTVNIDVSQFVTIDMFEALEARVDALEASDQAQDGHLDRIDEVNDDQNARLTALEARPVGGDTGNGVFDNLDISLDAGANLFATGIGARSFEGFGALQFTLWPSTHARIAPTLRIRAGGRMNDEGGIEIRNPVRLTAGVGAQVLLNQRLRLDVLVTTAAIWSSNTNASELGDGLRARNGIGGEVGLLVNLNRAGHATGAGLMPYFRFDLEAMSLQYNLLNDNAQNGFVRRTSLGGGLSFGVRWGLRDRTH